MTEADWLAYDQPHQLLSHYPCKLAGRKLRLFSCACCRTVWPDLTVDQRHYVVMAEQFADGHFSQQVFRNIDLRAFDEANTAAALLEPTRALIPWLVAWVVDSKHDEGTVARGVSQKLLQLQRDVRRNAKYPARILDLFHDVFGNPFRPVSINPVWLTSAVVDLSEAVYADRAFDRLPILADALEDAGCTDPAILDHCRQPGSHARGCWVVDLVLGKE